MSVLHGCLLEVLKGFEDDSFDSVVTDPPYGISMMNKKWDYDVPSVEMWKEVLRVLKPGGHILAFGGTRTYHRMVVNIEDAGFEIRDQIQWIYGSGFPKSLNISKAIDKEAGAEREVVGTKVGNPGYSLAPDKGRGVACVAHGNSEKECEVTIPSTEAAKQWDGFGTALKPANEPICLARKPLSEKTVARNVLKWGTAGLNIDASRIDGAKRSPGFKSPESEIGYHGGSSNKNLVDWDNSQGRFPANLILDEAAAAALDEMSGLSDHRRENESLGHHESVGSFGLKGHMNVRHHDSGGASRFFYVAKASKADRGAGNTHPTVKPTKLMEYLVTLVTPPGGTVLDPFCGSGSTGVAALRLGFEFVGIDKHESYVEIAKARIGA